VANAVRRGSGFKNVVINVYVPAFDEYRVEVIKGSVEAEAGLAGGRIPAEQLSELIRDIPQRVPGVFFLPGGTQVWEDFDLSFTPEIVPLNVENAWQAQDGLLVTLRNSSELPLGFLSVDEPESGLRPAEEDLRLLWAIAAHAEQALETAQHNSERDLTEQLGSALLKLATQLPYAATFRELEDEVGEVLSCQFGFERVAVYRSVDDGSMTLGQHRGWDPEDQVAHLADTIPAATIGAALTAGRIEDGCWLVPAAELFPDDRTIPRSRRNGHGSYGWGDHCLVVPAYVDGGVLSSVLVLEDPVDHALPSATRRRAIRLLAENASSAWTALLQRERLAHLATHDPLTGLRNRRGLSELIGQHREVAVLVCDVDHFKAINDSYGHDTGDRVLERVGALLRELARDTDVAIRLGGEEFGMVLPQTDHSRALGAAERLRAAVEARLTDIIPEGVTVSIGVAATSDGLLDAKDLLSAADRSMYAAKHSGRNRVGT
jgi:diguanylate cyclase (GGDEF)-like protein